VVGSELTGYVCDKWSPSSTPVSSFSSAEVFLPHPSQQVQWHSATTVALASTTPQPALGPLSGAVKYPAGARLNKCIIIILRDDVAPGAPCDPDYSSKVTTIP
jgi:hypothetical protein